MLAPKFLVAGLIALASASIHPEDIKFAALLKRQAPGTPSYNCHDNCGTAISLSRQPNKCENDAFKTNYKNCLQCAGPDNYNIWRMYGNTLSTAGASCGLSTEPLAGKQDDVGPAVRAGSSSSAGAASATSAAATPAPAPATVTSSAALSSVSGSPVASGNATASFTNSVPPQQSMNAGTHIGPVGVLGTVVVGAVVVGAMAVL
ncbi:hypothetical protein HBI56_036680 [Parastagonospora nodorum]|uniref:Uncharacterized protein n=1 Tax=Phaeosphaeria nodorum (strain SN15 / ATCC MYA-4574 / FGSC 10173) TaxID=321614 RepID=A0A7U2HX56_PHANO|nr:hypothetical protein HBH56_070120 [Parastagonospora nodorum]QRC93644.1 hypothetical protein JI435_038460 [Parastagonospora nodorum SN15]KAH3932204.1 hypothetical protein HBH54_078000 [Parastagonospora nodorum]KAH3955058.1 hypothetical protein HBH53_016370 [Parastagonospora nodorum]KAH3988125.1 hypothetical protein HBH51_001560 [Parastagonospora nodorum]